VFYVVIIGVTAAVVAVPIAATPETLCSATLRCYILSWRRRTVRFIDLPPLHATPTTVPYAILAAAAVA